MEYEITITWECDNSHSNNVVVTMHEENDTTTMDDINDMVEQMVSDPSFIRENSCKTCQNETQSEVDWEIVLIEKDKDSCDECD